MGKHSDGCPDTGHTGGHGCDNSMYGHGGDVDKGENYKPGQNSCFVATPAQQIWMAKMGQKYLQPHAAGRLVIAVYRVISPPAIAKLRQMPRTAKAVHRIWHGTFTAVPA